MALLVSAYEVKTQHFPRSYDLDIEEQRKSGVEKPQLRPSTNPGGRHFRNCGTQKTGLGMRTGNKKEATGDQWMACIVNVEKRLTKQTFDDSPGLYRPKRDVVH